MPSPCLVATSLHDNFLIHIFRYYSCYIVISPSQSSQFGEAKNQLKLRKYTKERANQIIQMTAVTVTDNKEVFSPLYISLSWNQVFPSIWLSPLYISLAEIKFSPAFGVYSPAPRLSVVYSWSPVALRECGHCDSVPPWHSASSHLQVTKWSESVTTCFGLMSYHGCTCKITSQWEKSGFSGRLGVSEGRWV